MSKTRKGSKYARDDIKHIRSLIENLKNKEDYNVIFDILTNDSETMLTHNPKTKEICLDLSVLSDKTLTNILSYINKINNDKSSKIEVDTDAIPNITSSNKIRTYKLSNYEQNIIKQRDLKKTMNNEYEYKELQLESKSKSKPTSTSKTTSKTNKSVSASASKSKTASKTNKSGSKSNKKSTKKSSVPKAKHYLS